MVRVGVLYKRRLIIAHNRHFPTSARMGSHKVFSVLLFLTLATTALTFDILWGGINRGIRIRRNRRNRRRCTGICKPRSTSICHRMSGRCSVNQLCCRPPIPKVFCQNSQSMLGKCMADCGNGTSLPGDPAGICGDVNLKCCIQRTLPRNGEACLNSQSLPGICSSDCGNGTSLANDPNTICATPDLKCCLPRIAPFNSEACSNVDENLGICTKNCTNGIINANDPNATCFDSEAVCCIRLPGDGDACINSRTMPGICRTDCSNGTSLANDPNITCAAPDLKCCISPTTSLLSQECSAGICTKECTNGSLSTNDSNETCSDAGDICYILTPGNGEACLNSQSLPGICSSDCGNGTSLANDPNTTCATPDLKCCLPRIAPFNSEACSNVDGNLGICTKNCTNGIFNANDPNATCFDSEAICCIHLPGIDDPCLDTSSNKTGICVKTADCNGTPVVGEPDQICRDLDSVCCLPRDVAGLLPSPLVWLTERDQNNTEYNFTIPMDGMCALRIDFHKFNLAPMHRLRGCEIDVLAFTGVESASKLKFCDNVNDHFYLNKLVDSEEIVAKISTGSSAIQREWNMTFTPITCTCPQADRFCHQYFTDSNGKIRSLSYADGETTGGYFPDFNYNICVMKKRRQCIHYTLSNDKFGFPRRCRDFLRLFNARRYCSDSIFGGQSTIELIDERRRTMSISRFRSNRQRQGQGFELTYEVYNC
ncbi:Uncharacterised protein g5736 [Pycnogonum litorale]